MRRARSSIATSNYNNCAIQTEDLICWRDAAQAAFVDFTLPSGLSMVGQSSRWALQ